MIRGLIRALVVAVVGVVGFAFVLGSGGPGTGGNRGSVRPSTPAPPYSPWEQSVVQAHHYAGLRASRDASDTHGSEDSPERRAEYERLSKRYYGAVIARAGLSEDEYDQIETRVVRAKGITTAGSIPFTIDQIVEGVTPRPDPGVAP